MTDEEALKEIDRQEKRFAAAKCGRGLQLAKSAREYYQTIEKCRQKSAEVAAECAAANEKAVAMTAETDRMEAEARQMLKEVSRRRSDVAKLRKVVRNGELIKNQEHKARLMFVEKVKRLATMPVEKPNGDRPPLRAG